MKFDDRKPESSSNAVEEPEENAARRAAVQPRISLQANSMDLYLERASKLPWERYLGQDVLVEVPDDEKTVTVSQSVRSLADLNQHEAKVVRRLLDSYDDQVLASNFLLFSERAGALFESKQDGYSPELVDSDFERVIQAEHLNLAFQDCTELISDAEGCPDVNAISFFHTHFGKGTPLSAMDANAFEDFVSSLEFESEGKVRVSIWAIPIDDQGEILFRKSCLLKIDAAGQITRIE